MQKTKIWKSCSSILLAASLVVCADVPVTVAASEDSGLETVADETSIVDAAEEIVTVSGDEGLLSEDTDTEILEDVPDDVSVEYAEEALLPVGDASATTGTLGTSNGITWTYDAENATLTLTGEDELHGTYEEDDLYSSAKNGFNDILSDKTVKRIVFHNCKLKNDASWLFAGLNVKEIDMSGLDTSAVTDMSNMFYCYWGTKLDLSSFDTSAVTNMSRMFANCERLKVDLSNFNTSAVTDMSFMFYSYSSDLKFDLNNDMKLDLRSFDTSAVTDIRQMFIFSNLAYFVLGNFNSSVGMDMSLMFYEVRGMDTVDWSKVNISGATNMSCMFFGSDAVRLDLSGFDTSTVRDMSYMFSCCHKLEYLNLSSFNTSAVTDMSCMFGCEKLKELDLSSFDMGNVKNASSMISTFVQDPMTYVYSPNELQYIKTPRVIPISIGLSNSYDYEVYFYDEYGCGYNYLDSINAGMLLRRDYGTYVITYNMDGGTNHASNPETYEAFKSDFTLKKPQKVGYRFEGWYSDAQLTKKVTKIKKGTKKDITLYAKWTELVPLQGKYTIKFDKNGATSGKMGTVSCSYGNSYTLKNNVFVRKGYQFAGWNEKADGSGKSFSNKAEIMNLGVYDEDIVTLYAQWEPVVYTVTYYLKDGTNSAENPATYTVKDASVTLKAPTKTGYTFKGWYSDSKYKTKVKKIAGGATGNKKLYAKWTPYKYTIKFNKNGATSGKMSSKSCSYGKSYKLTKNAFKRKGYNFTGWNTQPDGSGESFTNKQEINTLVTESGGSITLYAQWEAK